MKRFFLRLFMFLSPLVILLVIYVQYILPRLLQACYGECTERQIQLSLDGAAADRYDVMVLGRSTEYRGFNPEKLSLPAYNLAHDNDGYNHCWYKLQYLEKKKIHFKYLVLGVDYESFSYLRKDRNYVYKKFFSSEYLLDYKEPLSLKRISDDLRFFVEMKFGESFFKATACMRSKISGNAPKKLRDLTPRGQYLVYERKAHLMESPLRDTSPKDFTRLAVQERYFDRILQYCAAEGIKVFLLQFPVRAQLLGDCCPQPQAEEFTSFIRSKTDGKNVFFLDYSADTRFNWKDFCDFDHLSPEASGKFAEIFDTDMRALLRGKI